MEGWFAMARASGTLKSTNSAQGRGGALISGSRESWMPIKDPKFGARGRSKRRGGRGEGGCFGIPNYQIGRQKRAAGGWHRRRQPCIFDSVNAMKLMSERLHILYLIISGGWQDL